MEACLEHDRHEGEEAEAEEVEGGNDTSMRRFDRRRSVSRDQRDEREGERGEGAFS